MDTGISPTTLEWMIEPLNGGPLVPVIVERAVPTDLYFEIVAATEDLEVEFIITV